MSWPGVEEKPRPIPGSKCAFADCLKPATSKGMCSAHYRKVKNGKIAPPPGMDFDPVLPKQDNSEKDPVLPKQDIPPESSKVEVSAEDVKGLIVITMTTLAMTVDESFSVVDVRGNLLPHAQAAIHEMTPFLQKYASSLARMSPYIGFGMGCFALIAPALGPTTEIIAGVRKPRIMRTRPDDVYTDAFKQAQAKRQEKAANQTVTVEGNGEQKAA